MSQIATAVAPTTNEYAPAIDDGNVRQYLTTALRYLMTPRELLSLWRMDDMTIRELGVTRQELCMMLASVRPVSEK